MADAQLKQKIHDSLKTVYFADPDDSVDVSDGPKRQHPRRDSESEIRWTPHEGEERPDLVTLGTEPQPRGMGQGFFVGRGKSGRDQS